MITLLKLILTTSILVLGWTIATQKDMILHSARVWGEKKKSEGWGIMEAVVLCHWCMPSIWATLGYSFSLVTGIVSYFNWETILMYPMVVCGSSLFCGIIWESYHMIENISKYFKTINDGNETQEQQ